MRKRKSDNERTEFNVKISDGCAKIITASDDINVQMSETFSGGEWGDHLPNNIDKLDTESLVDLSGALAVTSWMSYQVNTYMVRLADKRARQAVSGEISGSGGRKPDQVVITGKDLIVERED